MGHPHRAGAFCDWCFLDWPVRAGFAAIFPVLIVFFVVLLAAPAAIAGDSPPQVIDVRYPPGAERHAERLQKYVPNMWPAAARWLGMPLRGTPRFIFVENHERMQEIAGPSVREWAIAVALSDDRIVFRLDRIDHTPAARLELVADHELVHQLLNHLGGTRLPRWFEEGLCVTYAGIPFLDMDSSLELAAAAGALPSFEDTDAMFSGGASEAAKAYAIGHRAVKALIARRGEAAMRRILEQVAQGVAFDAAFLASTGTSLAEFEDQWRRAVTPPVPFLVYLLFENIGLSLLVVGAGLVFLGWLRRRLRRERDMRSLPG